MINRIRPFIFETNSSLTNALILFDKDMYEKWDKDCNLYINLCEKNPAKVYTREEAVSAILGCDSESDEEDLSEDELACEGFMNNETIYKEGYSLKKLDLDVIGQKYIVLSACREDR